MPIIRAETTKIRAICDSCAEERDVLYADLLAGWNDDTLGMQDKDQCKLPACPCGTGEILFRTWDVHPKPGSYGERHRKLVNRVFQLLIAKGYVEPALSDVFDAEVEAPSDIDAGDPEVETIVVGARPRAAAVAEE